MSSYEQFAEQAQQMRDELVSSATARADAWLKDTLAMLRSLYAVNGPKNQSVPEPDVMKKVEDSLTIKAIPALPVLARSAINRIPSDTFSTNDVAKIIESEHKMESDTWRANLSHTLKRLAKNGELVAVQTGRGSNPSVYKKVKLTF